MALEEFIAQILPFLLALGSGAVFGLFFWVTNTIDPTKPTTTFYLPCLLVTIAYSAVVGVYFTAIGVEVTLESIASQFAIDMVMIIFLQRSAQALWRKYFGTSGEVTI